MIKSTWKKAMLVGAVAMLVASPSFAAKKKKGADPYKNITKQKNPDTKKVWDFKGMEIIIGDWWSDPDAQPASKAQEDEMAWRQWTQDTYNVKIKQMAVSGWGSNPQFVSNFCITGGDENYVMIIDSRSATTGMRANLFYDLSTIKSVDYKDGSKYEQSTVGLLKRGNSYYGFNWGKPEPRNGMFFNKRILAENGYDPDLPYDMQKNGTWTWDAFEEMCKKMTRDTDNDGVIDQYAMASFNTEFSFSALDSNGAKIIDLDKNGKYVNVAGSENAMETWNWIQHMFLTYQRPQAEGENWDYFYNAFINGEVAFLADQEYNAQPNGKFSGMADDYGFVCFPMGPHGDGVYKTVHQNNICIIPSCYSAERAENIAKAVDLWLEPTPGYDSPDAWKEGYYASFRDERAVDETLQLMADTPNARLDVLISGLNQGDIIWPLCAGAGTPQELYEGCYNVWQGLIDDCNR